MPQCTKDPSLLAMAGVYSGYAHYALKQYGNARQDFEAVVKEQPGNAAAYRGLGLVAQRAGSITQAAREYEQAVELDPTPMGYLLLAQALELGGQAEAARAAQSQAASMTRDLNDDMAIVKQLLAN
jgi:tetratricopeptide (TPR) repeat protein